MKEIKLTQGKVALVDDEDFEYLNQWKWHYNQGYAISSKNKKHKLLLMHRVILNPPSDLCIDHINHNKIDNQKKNIRICNGHENARNAVHVGKTSNYLGVYYDMENKKYKAQIKINGCKTHIGRYIYPEEAARAYDKMALLHFGEFANLNFK
jgi:hypothetical protein